MVFSKGVEMIKKIILETIIRPKDKYLIGLSCLSPFPAWMILSILILINDKSEYTPTIVLICFIPVLCWSLFGLYTLKRMVMELTITEKELRFKTGFLVNEREFSYPLESDFKFWVDKGFSMQESQFEIRKDKKYQTFSIMNLYQVSPDLTVEHARGIELPDGLLEIPAVLIVEKYLNLARKGL